MKYTKIALACGFALSAMSAQAAVVDIPAGTVTIYVSGASAVDNFFADTVNSMMTNVTAVRGPTNDSAYRAYLGTSNGVAGVSNGTNILLIKRSTGGSFFGVNPVARSEKITTLDFTNCTALVGDPAYQFECATKGDDQNGADGEVPDFGLSDVEPFMFQGINLGNGQSALSAAELAALVSQPVNQQAMGIVATNAVANTTHLSRAAYGAMLAGKINTWEVIDGSTDPVIVCRRTNGSGTQASYNWFFSGFPCNTASNGFSANVPATTAGQTEIITGGSGTSGDPFIVDPTANEQAVIVENAGSGDVRGCLTAANNQQDLTRVDTNGNSYRYEFSKLPAAGKAIGVLSMDSYNRTFAASYRYLDGAGVFDATAQTGAGSQTGIAPSKANIVDGRYDFVLELAANERAGTTGEKKAFWNQLVRNLGSSTYTGDTTFNSVPNAFATLPTSESYVDEPAKVSKYTRNANTCSAMVFTQPL